MFPRQFVEPAIIDPGLQITGVRLDFKFRFRRNRLSKPAPRQFVYHHFEGAARIPGSVRDFPRKLGFQRKRCPYVDVRMLLSHAHVSIMMPPSSDVKMSGSRVAHRRTSIAQKPGRNC